jgi:hypothetical protein
MSLLLFHVTDDLFPCSTKIDRAVTQSREDGLYLAKDARQSRRMFEAGYPGLERFRDLRRATGAEGQMASRLSTRLGI